MMQVLDSSNTGVSAEHTTIGVNLSEDRSTPKRKPSEEGRELTSQNDKPMSPLLTSSKDELKQKEKVSSSQGDAKYGKNIF